MFQVGSPEQRKRVQSQIELTKTTQKYDATADYTLKKKISQKLEASKRFAVQETAGG
jgi:hypothetical protein